MIMDIEFGATHPLDIRDASRDPADIDLAPFRDAAHADRIAQEARTTQRRHERTRARGETGLEWRMSLDHLTKLED